MEIGTKLLEVKNISKKYKFQVLNNVSFDLYKGEILGVLGYSGSGKTTLLNIICGLVQTDSGEVIHYLKENKTGESIRHFSYEMKSFVGFSTQEPSFYKELTIKENLFYFARLMRIKKKHLSTLVKDILVLFKLHDFKDLKAKSLSGGMKKRLDLACSMIGSPKILILDEPTESLDFSLREELKRILVRIKQRGIGIIFISHIVEEIEEIADRVLFLDHTKSVLIPTTDRLKERFTIYINRGNKK
jgi:ABC-2 type transport system ATP-binding protein